MIWVWVGIVCVSAIVEALSWDMTSVWITCGGLVALIICAIGAPLWAQIIPFIIITALLIIFIRPIVKKSIDKKTVKTNSSSLVGEKFKLLTDIKESMPGSLKVNDVIWTATSEDDCEINAGTYVEIVEIKGNKLIVKPAEENEKLDKE